MKLQQLIQNIKGVQIEAVASVDIKTLVFDSRKVEKGALFVAVKGIVSDGHDYIESAIEKGASAIIAEKIPNIDLKGVSVIKVENSQEALARIASSFYADPSSEIKLVGVTGTNGKTTIATLLHQMVTEQGYKTGLLSTIENKIGQQVIPSTHTTPDVVKVNELLREMVDAGCDYAFMEVSSHAIDQGRVSGLTFAGGIFTNISHDHLDYHKTFKNYIETKKKFFDILPKSAFALVNLDDKRAKVMVQNTAAKVKTYALRSPANFKGRIIEMGLEGLELDFDGTVFLSRLIGRFNADNLLAVYGASILLGFDRMEVLQVLSNLKTAAGRFEYLTDPKGKRIAIIDYAHTPDALEKVLSTISELKEGNRKVITVVGCGGDRDKTKRPLMAKIGADYSDQLIITSDNPRTEDPGAIIADMEAGIPAYASQRTLTIKDRLSAIRTACKLGENEGAIILIAGKGHEKYQEIMGEKIPFDEKAILNKELNHVN